MIERIIRIIYVILMLCVMAEMVVVYAMLGFTFHRVYPTAPLWPGFQEISSDQG